MEYGEIERPNILSFTAYLICGEGGSLINKSQLINAIN